MNELHLFAGIGGGILGGRLCGHRCICAVELDPYCRSVLVQRQNDRHLAPFPIWDDIRTFDGSDWRGSVDVVSGGFPCQNISPAGDRTGITGDKSSLWFEMLRVIREIRPRYVFVENSAQLIRRGLDVILGGLDESGYDAEWCVLGADDVGAPHRRKRCWILGRMRASDNVSDTAGDRLEMPGSAIQTTRTAGICTKVPDTGNNGLEQWFGQLPGIAQNEGGRFDNGGGMSIHAFREWWKIEPGVGRVVDGISYRLERLKGLGNAQVPLCAAVAWYILYERSQESE